MKLTAHIAFDTEASTREAIPAVERAIAEALDTIEIPHAYAAGTAHVESVGVVVEESRYR